MLEAFRKAAQGWAAKVLLSLLVIAFGVWGITDVFSGISVSFARWTGFGPQDLAKVGDVVINSETFRQDLNKNLQRVSRQMGGTLSLEDARKLGLDQQTFDQMINAAVVDAAADRLKLAVSDKTIVDQAAANPAFQNAEGKFDPTTFRMILEQNGLNEQAFLASNKVDMTRRFVTSAAASPMPTPKTLTEAMLRYQGETRDARYFTLTVAESDVPAPTDAELQQQYESTPAAYTAPEYRSIAMMKVEPADVASKLAVSDVEVQDAYEKSKADYFTPERRTILQISFPNIDAAKAAKARIDAGEDFMKVATETGAKESDITFTDRLKGDFLDPAIGEAAFAIAEGTVSDPVSGALNTVLLKAAKVTPEHQKTLDEARPAVIKAVQLQKARDEIQSIYDAVEDARASQTKFEDIASKAGISFVLVPAVSQGGTGKDGKAVDMPGAKDVLKAAFESDVGVENDALPVGDGYVWYEVREVVPSALKPLADIKAQVTSDYVARKLRGLAGEKAKSLIDKAAGQTLDQLATANGNAAIKTVAGVKRADVSEEFDGSAALALFAAPQGQLTWSLGGDGKSARIIEVSKVTTPAFDPASDEAKSRAEETKVVLASDMSATFVKALRGSAEVTVNDPLWETIRGGQAQQ